MRRSLILAALTLFVVAPTQADDAPEGREGRSLSRSLAWLVGTWEDASAPRNSNADATKMSFRWAAGKQVLLMEGTYVAEEATWSYAAVFFYDRVKDRIRVFSFNSDGQRHLGILVSEDPGKLAWRMSGLLPDGRAERFVMEFVKDGKQSLTFRLRDRRPAEGESGEGTSVTLRRTVADSRR